MGKRVLLVDTDMRKSVLQRRMGLEGVKLGLSEYLSGNAEVGKVIYDVGIPNMHVLFSGKLVTNASTSSPAPPSCSACRCRGFARAHSPS